MIREQRLKVNGLPAMLFWGLMWQIAAAVIDNPLLLPAPVQVLKCLGRLMGTVSFWQMTLLSIGRILMGVLGAIGLGVLLAVVTSWSRVLNMLITPVISTMQATPVASFTILVLIWIDRDYVPVLICGMMVLPVIFGSVSTGIQVTDKQLLEMGKIYHLPVMTTMRRIYLPSVRPFFRTACLNAIGLGWKAGIAAEVLTVPRNSIGRMISESKLYLLTEELFAWTLTVIVLSMLLQKAMLLVIKGRGEHA